MAAVIHEIPLERRTLHGHFSCDLEPALTVDPGETIAFACPNAGWWVGPGRIDDSGNRVPLDISVGDTVIYSKYGGTEVKYSGEEYLILSARDVLAVVTK